jgi:hypothetical protein
MLVLRRDHPRPDRAVDDPESKVAIGRPPLIIATALPPCAECRREIRAPLAHRIKRLPRNPTSSRGANVLMHAAQHVEQMRVAV